MHLSHLKEAEKAEITFLIDSYRTLFSESQTCEIEQGIDVDVMPIKQTADRVNPVYRGLLCAEVEYMLAQFNSVESLFLDDRPDRSLTFLYGLW